MAVQLDAVSVSQQKFHSPSGSYDKMSITAMKIALSVNGEHSTIQIDTVSASATSNSEEVTVSTSSFTRQANTIDILYLLMAVMKLFIRQREQYKLDRREEKDAQLKSTQAAANDRSSQGSGSLYTGVIAGVIGVISSIIPVFGHLFGSEILGALSSVTKRFQGMKQDEFFKSGAKMLQSASKVMEVTGQAQQAFQESHHTLDQFNAERAQFERDNATQCIRDKSEEWQTLQSTLDHFLRIQHESATAAYR